jgi:hypothetical protein
MQDLWDKIKTSPIAKVGLGLLLLLIAVMIFAPKSRADGPTKTASILPEIPGVTTKGSWTGFGGGVYGSYINADTDTTPSAGLTGQSLGGTISASIQMGSLVLETFGTYGTLFGDLKDLGVDTEMSLGGRACVLATQQTAFCAVGAKLWLDTDAGNIDGWQYGGAVKFRPQNTPLELAFEYLHSTYDTAGVLGVDTTSDSVRAVITYRLGSK